jgi:hypothetical protein
VNRAVPAAVTNAVSLGPQSGASCIHAAGACTALMPPRPVAGPKHPSGVSSTRCRRPTDTQICHRGTVSRIPFGCHGGVALAATVDRIVPYHQACHGGALPRWRRATVAPTGPSSAGLPPAVGVGQPAGLFVLCHGHSSAGDCRHLDGMPGHSHVWRSVPQRPCADCSSCRTGAPVALTIHHPGRAPQQLAQSSE